MAKLKVTKLTLALFIILQLSPIKASEAAPSMPATLTALDTTIAETIELLEIDIPKGSLIEIIETLELIKKEYTEVYEKRFENVTEYPEMSLCDLGDAIINIIEKTGNKLPVSIKDNLIKLVNIKKMSNSIVEIKAAHPLISDILIQIIDLKIDAINSEFSTLLKYITSDDISEIKSELKNYKKNIIKRQQNNIFKSPDDVKKDLKAINDKLEKIWLNHPIYAKIKGKFNIVEEKPLSALDLLAKKALDGKRQLELMNLFNYRISQNKKHK